MAAPATTSSSLSSSSSAPLRQRHSKTEKPPATPTSNEDRTTITALDVLRMAGGLLLLSSLLSYLITSTIFWGGSTAQIRRQLWLARTAILGPLELTDAELAQYDGRDAGRAVYIGLNGSIYDVSAGRERYSPGGSYGFFAGRDATRAFVTGCFGEDLTWDLRGVEEMFVPVDDDGDEGEGEEGGLTKAQVKIRREREVREAKRRVQEAVQHWEGFFRNSDRYFYVGRVVGREGWEERVERRGLCEKARGLRPKRKKGDGDGEGK
jgi:predicted heme/steroid binding protein